MSRCLLTLLLLHIGDFKRFILDKREGQLTFFLTGIFACRGSEQRVAIDRGEHPIGLRLEIVDLLLPVDNQSQGRRLYSTDGEHLMVAAVHASIETRTVHPQQPVADGPAQSCHVKALVVPLLFQVLKTFADGLIGHRRNPQPLDRALHSGELHHPTLDKLTFLSGITAVDNLVGLAIQGGYHIELPFDRFLRDELDAKARRNHRQGGQRPITPVHLIVIGLLQLTQMSESPCHLVAVAFHIAILRYVGTQDARDVFCYARFLRCTNDHIFSGMSI